MDGAVYLMGVIKDKLKKKPLTFFVGKSVKVGLRKEGEDEFSEYVWMLVEAVDEGRNLLIGKLMNHPHSRRDLKEGDILKVSRDDVGLVNDEETLMEYLRSHLPPIIPVTDSQISATLNEAIVEMNLNPDKYFGAVKYRGKAVSEIHETLKQKPLSFFVGRSVRTGFDIYGDDDERPLSTEYIWIRVNGVDEGRGLLLGKFEEDPIVFRDQFKKGDPIEFKKGAVWMVNDETKLEAYLKAHPPAYVPRTPLQRTLVREEAITEMNADLDKYYP